jgi:hypothetical protein
MKMDDDGDDYTFAAAQPVHLRFAGDTGIMGPPLLYSLRKAEIPSTGCSGGARDGHRDTGMAPTG